MQLRANPGKWVPTVYFVIGQAAWFVCVISAAKMAPWIGVSLVIVLVAIHVLRASRPLRELKFVACMAVIGGCWDSALVFFGLLAYPSGTVIAGAAPVWIVALWALFAAQFNTTYRWLKPRITLAAVFGAIAGPLSFRGGAALHAVHFVKPWPAAAALAAGWGALLPVMILLSRRWDGVRQL